MKLQTKILASIFATIAAIVAVTQLAEQLRSRAILRRVAEQQLRDALDTQWDVAGRVLQASETSIV